MPSLPPCLPGTAGEALQVSVDPGGLLAICCHSDGCLRLIDLQTGALRFRAWGHGSLVRAATVSQDCSRVVSVGADGCIITWRLPDSLAADMRAAAARVAVVRRQLGGEPAAKKASPPKKAAKAAASPVASPGSPAGTPQQPSASSSQQATPSSAASEGELSATIQRVKQGKPLVSADKLPRWARSPTKQRSGSADGKAGAQQRAGASASPSPGGRISRWLAGRRASLGKAHTAPPEQVRASVGLGECGRRASLCVVPRAHVACAHTLPMSCRPQDAADGGGSGPSAAGAGAADTSGGGTSSASTSAAGTSGGGGDGGWAAAEQHAPLWDQDGMVVIRHWHGDGSAFSAPGRGGHPLLSSTPGGSARQSGARHRPSPPASQPGGEAAAAAVRDLFRQDFSGSPAAASPPADRRSLSAAFKDTHGSCSPPAAEPRRTRASPADALDSPAAAGGALGHADDAAEAASPPEKRWRLGRMDAELAGMWDKLSGLEQLYQQQQTRGASPLRGASRGAAVGGEPASSPRQRQALTAAASGLQVVPAPAGARGAARRGSSSNNGSSALRGGSPAAACKRASPASSGSAQAAAAAAAAVAAAAASSPMRTRAAWQRPGSATPGSVSRPRSRGCSDADDGSSTQWHQAAPPAASTPLAQRAAPAPGLLASLLASPDSGSEPPTPLPDCCAASPVPAPQAVVGRPFRSAVSSDASQSECRVSIGGAISPMAPAAGPPPGAADAPVVSLSPLAPAPAPGGGALEARASAAPAAGVTLTPPSERVQMWPGWGSDAGAAWEATPSPELALGARAMWPDMAAQATQAVAGGGGGDAAGFMLCNPVFDATPPPSGGGRASSGGDQQQQQPFSFTAGPEHSPAPDNQAGTPHAAKRGSAAGKGSQGGGADAPALEAEAADTQAASDAAAPAPPGEPCSPTPAATPVAAASSGAPPDTPPSAPSSHASSSRGGGRLSFRRGPSSSGGKPKPKAASEGGGSPAASGASSPGSPAGMLGLLQRMRMTLPQRRGSRTSGSSTSGGAPASVLDAVQPRPQAQATAAAPPHADGRPASGRSIGSGSSCASAAAAAEVSWDAVRAAIEDGQETAKLRGGSAAQLAAAVMKFKQSVAEMTQVFEELATLAPSDAQELAARLTPSPDAAADAGPASPADVQQRLQREVLATLHGLEATIIGPGGLCCAAARACPSSCGAWRQPALDALQRSTRRRPASPCRARRQPHAAAHARACTHWRRARVGRRRACEPRVAAAAPAAAAAAGARRACPAAGAAAAMH